LLSTDTSNIKRSPHKSLPHHDFPKILLTNIFIMKSLKTFFLFIVLCQCWLGFSTVAQAAPEPSIYWNYIAVKKNAGPEVWVFEVPGFDRFAYNIDPAPRQNGLIVRDFDKVKINFYTTWSTYFMTAQAGFGGVNPRLWERVEAVCDGRPRSHTFREVSWNGYQFGNTETVREIQYQCAPVADPVPDEPKTRGSIAYAHCLGVVDYGASDQINGTCFLKRPPVRRALAALCDTAAERATQRCTYIQTQLNLLNKAHPSSGLPGNDAPR
jgi:hypothetical protein